MLVQKQKLCYNRSQQSAQSRLEHMEVESGLRRKRWFKLDNAAKLYPAVSNDHWSSTFRVSADLYELIDPDRLQKAVNHVLKRFPSIQVPLPARDSMFGPLLPMPLPPDVQNGITVIPSKLYFSTKVSRIRGSSPHQIGKPR